MKTKTDTAAGQRDSHCPVEWGGIVPTQDEIYARMSPAQRLAQAHRLWRQARSLAECGVRLRHPAADPAEIQQRLARLFLHGSE